MQELELGELRPDEVLVKVAAAGVCHTDLIVRDQWYPVPLPAVLGHEGAGIVEAVGDGVTKVVPGDHVGDELQLLRRVPDVPDRPTQLLPRLLRAATSGRRGPTSTTALSRDGEAIHSHFFGQSSFATYSVATERNVVKLDPDVTARGRRAVRLRHPDRRRRDPQHDAAGRRRQRRGLRHRHRRAGSGDGRRHHRRDDDRRRRRQRRATRARA